MGWRFLVDEDTDIDAATALTDRGHDAVTVETAVGKGKPDTRVGFERLADFLDAELNAGLRVLLVSADDAEGEKIAAKADELAQLAGTQII